MRWSSNTVCTKIVPSYPTVDGMIRVLRVESIASTHQDGAAGITRVVEPPRCAPTEYQGVMSTVQSTVTSGRLSRRTWSSIIQRPIKLSAPDWPW
jgi:hypothetical protein